MNKPQFSPKSRVFSALYRVLIGIVFGFANIIPGVSGGTAMVVFGVYERIILIITDFRKRIKTEWRFFLPIIIGMGVSILAFGMLMDKVLESNKQLAQMFFIGVIVFSVPMIFKKAVLGKRNPKKDGICALCFIAMLAIMIGMAAFNANNPSDAEAEAPQAATLSEPVEADATETEKTFLDNALNVVLMVVCGAVACATMIIPGISGSLVMVMLGVYEDIISAVSSLDFAALIPFAIGMVIGIVFCAKLIKFLLNKYSRETYSAILGFVVGSVFSIFPGWSYILPALAFMLGAAAIVGCDALSKKAES